MKINKYLLITLAGIILIWVLPLSTSSLVTVPYSPYIPDNYYSRGIIDYTNSQTGVYYIAVLPYSSTGATVDSATFYFAEADVTLDLALVHVLPVSPYDQYKFWRDTNIVSDGLQFNTNYTITVTVEDNLGRTDSVTDWILFVGDSDPGNGEEIPSDNVVTDNFLMFIPGAVLTSFGLIGYVRRKK